MCVITWSLRLLWLTMYVTKGFCGRERWWTITTRSKGKKNIIINNNLNKKIQVEWSGIFGRDCLPSSLMKSQTTLWMMMICYTYSSQPKPRATNLFFYSFTSNTQNTSQKLLSPSSNLSYVLHPMCHMSKPPSQCHIM